MISRITRLQIKSTGKGLNIKVFQIRTTYQLNPVVYTQLRAHCLVTLKHLWQSMKHFCTLHKVLPISLVHLLLQRHWNNTEWRWRRQDEAANMTNAFLQPSKTHNLTWDKTCICDEYRGEESNCFPWTWKRSKEKKDIDAWQEEKLLATEITANL